MTSNSKVKKVKIDKKMIIDSSGTDVYSHLAYEEILMEEVSGPVLMLWQSNCAVVMEKIKIRGWNAV